MKKPVIFLFILAQALANLQAQENNETVVNKTDLRHHLMLGVKGGLNYSNVYDSGGEEFSANNKYGLAIGSFIAIPIGRLFGIQPEIMYSEKGFKATGRILGSSYNLTRTTSFIDVPLLFAFKPSEFTTFVAGPQFSYLLRQKDEFKNATTTIEQEREFVNENYRKNILCFTAGMDLTLKHLVLGARAGWDIQNNNGDGSSTTPRYKNVWYQATIGYRFYH